MGSVLSQGKESHNPCTHHLFKSSDYKFQNIVEKVPNVKSGKHICRSSVQTSLYSFYAGGSLYSIHLQKKRANTLSSAESSTNKDTFHENKFAVIIVTHRVSHTLPASLHCLHAITSQWLCQLPIWISIVLCSTFLANNIIQKGCPLNFLATHLSEATRRRPSHDVG
jgi:hypothetical protein